MARLTTGQKGILVSGVLLLVAYFFPWQEIVCISPPASPVVECSSQRGVAGIGWPGFLFVIAVLLWEAGIVSGKPMNTGTVSPSLISAALGGAAAAFTLVKFLTTLDGEDFLVGLRPDLGAWIGLGLSAVLAVSSWLRYRESRTGPAEG